jgi:hypothetical protein
MLRFVAIAALAASLAAGATIPASAQSADPGFGACLGLMFANPSGHTAQCGTFRGDEPGTDAIMGDGDSSCGGYALLLRGLEHGERIDVAGPIDPCGPPP